MVESEVTVETSKAEAMVEAMVTVETSKAEAVVEVMVMVKAAEAAMEASKAATDAAPVEAPSAVKHERRGRRCINNDGRRCGQHSRDHEGGSAKGDGLEGFQGMQHGDNSSPTVNPGLACIYQTAAIMVNTFRPAIIRSRAPCFPFASQPQLWEAESGSDSSYVFSMVAHTGSNLDPLCGGVRSSR
jgi:hypothetical protein